MSHPNPSTLPSSNAASDHRPKMAEKKRLMMRTRLLDSAMRVFADSGSVPPVIDDVIREAKVSRGTFYRYFDSLEQVLIALGQDLSNQMTTDILPLYDILEEPWKRVSVGFRVFLVRALLDRKWAGFVTRVDVWPHHALVAEYMSRDLERGRASGQLSFERIDVATDFLMGASAHSIQAILQGVDDVNGYMDACVHMALLSVGADAATCRRGVEFSLNYLQEWGAGALELPRPVWALNLNSREGREFLAYRRVVANET